MMDKLLTIGLKSQLIAGKNTVMESLKKALQAEKLQEEDILVITSKVVAISQGRVKKISTEEDLNQLVQAESDEYYGSQSIAAPGKALDQVVPLTKKNNIFIPWAGIDRSNMPENMAVLWPGKPYETAAQLLSELKSHYKIQKLGLIISDSVCLPLRKGVSAMAIGYAGFKGVKDFRGKPDLYGKKLKFSQQNMADMLAVSAHLVMGESTEQTPFAIIRGAKVQFTSLPIDPSEAVMPAQDCLFAPLY